MILDRASAHDVTAEDVQELVATRQRELDRLEFKRERTEDLHEHVCGIANAGGGYIVVGIQVDREDRAQSIFHIDRVESVATSIRQQLGETITPRPLYEVVPLATNSQDVIIVRVAPNNGPHMVSVEQRTDFYTRSGTQTLTMRYPEIEQQFREKLTAGSLEEIAATPRAYVDTTVGRRLMTTGTTGMVDQIASSIAESSQSMLAIFSVIDAPKRTTGEGEVVGIFGRPTYYRQGGWSVVHDRLDVSHIGGDIVQDYGGSSRTSLTPSLDFVFLKAVDEVLCWRQPESEFARSPRLYSNALVEYCLSFAFSCGDLLAIARPEMIAVVAMLVNAENTQLPLGEGGTPWFDNPINPPHRPSASVFRSRLIVRSGDERLRPRSLAFEIAQQIYGFYEYGPDNVAFASADEVTFGADDFDVRLSAIGSYLQATLGVRFERPFRQSGASVWWFGSDRDMRRFNVGVSRELVEESGASEKELFDLLDSMNVVACAASGKGAPVLLTTEGCRLLSPGVG